MRLRRDQVMPESTNCADRTERGGYDVRAVGDTYDPELYDLFHPPQAEDSDIALYQQLARESGGPVLELGVGTGRTLLPIARDGVSIVGMDTSPRMLEALRQRLAGEAAEVRERVRIETGDMRDFSLEERFSLITIPFRGFLHNQTKGDQRACLRACHRHLCSGGALAFSVFHPSLEFGRDDDALVSGVWRWRGSRERADGGHVDLSECTIYDTEQQRLSARLRYEAYDARGRLEYAHMHRLELGYLYPTDIRGLLGEMGFVDVQIEGGFAGAPFAEDAKELIVRARRP